MTLRARALEWLQARGGAAADGHVVTSKRYRPDESWTAAKAWWIQVPLAAIEADKTIHMLCETQPGSGTFRHLVVPPGFFRENAESLAVIGERAVNLFLSAEKAEELQDQRGPGRLSFARFEREH